MKSNTTVTASTPPTAPAIAAPLLELLPVEVSISIFEMHTYFVKILHNSALMLLGVYLATSVATY